MLKNNIEVAKGFQTSVNIAYDLNDSAKIKSFIPTLSSLDIIEDVMLSTSQTSTDRARILIGAYGRGKSHVILVLLSLLFNKDKDLFEKILEKIRIYNTDLYDYVNNYLCSTKKLLPIVVSGSSTSLTQSFLFALQRSLSNNNLEAIMPDTHFTASVNAIDNWKREYPETYAKFVAELGEPVEDYILRLKEYNVEAYEKFISLYPKLTAGSTFNPFLGFDVVELYEKVVEKLCGIGYSGIYIVYDEFSKYLESSIGNATISDIKLLQDFAEKCNRSGKKQMHLMLICHKDIANYIDAQLPKEKVDGWRGVSGRFKHTTLHNNFSQMYEIISAVIKKEDAFWVRFCAENKEQFLDLKQRYISNGIIDGMNEDAVNAAIYGCYPLHPLSTFILPRLSEKVAQNERTLFTFLSSEEKNSLSEFLNKTEGSFPMLTPDCLYDYFEPLLRKEPYTSDIFKLYRLTSNVLQKVEPGSLNAKIIKTISLIYIVEQFEKLPPVYDTIVDAFRESVTDTKQISDALSELVNKECIVYLKRSNNFLKIKESSGVDIPTQIAKRIETIKTILKPKDILNRASFDSFIYPTRYNDEHEVTRYFDFLFISGEDFWKVTDWNSKVDATAADGIVYAIIPNNSDDIANIEAAILSGQGAHDRIVFCLPKKHYDIGKIAYEYRAVLDLRELSSDDDLLNEEYSIYIEDLEEVISNYVNAFLRPDSNDTTYYFLTQKQPIYRKAQMSALLSNICEQTYPHYPTINNESINKNILPTVAINSRNKLLNGLLSNVLDSNLGLTGTGQDVSIMRSTLLQTGIIENIATQPTINLNPKDENVRYMIQTIQSFVVGAGINGEQSLSTLYKLLTAAENGIGLKKGVVPIYFAVILHLHKQNIVIKKGDSEQKITADLLNMINEAPDNYSLVLENWNEEKTSYMSQLEQLFVQYVHEQEKAYNSFAYIVSAMNRWYMALPKYSKEMTKVYKGISSKEQFKSVSASRRKFVNSLKQLDINPRDYLFEKLFSFFGFSGFSIDVIDNITQTKKEYDEATTALIKVLISDIKIIFSNNHESKSSLTSIIEDWIMSLKETTTQHLFSNNENRVLDLMKTVTNDESTFVQRLAKCVTSLRIEDWSEKTILSFIEDLKSFKTTVDEFNQKEQSPKHEGDSFKLITITSEGKEIVKSFDRIEYSDRARLLYNDILNSIDEMGQSISEHEKRQILFEILDKFC